MSRDSLRIVIVLLIIIILLREEIKYQASTTATVTPTTPTDQVQESTSLPFTVEIQDGLYPNEREQIQTALAEAYPYVVSRFNATINGGDHAPKPVTFIIYQNCDMYGVAYTDRRNLQVFTCNEIPSIRAVNILAHELGHQLSSDVSGNHYKISDSMLMEGLATYTAGKYWLGKYPDFKSFVVGEYGPDNLYPLREENVYRNKRVQDQMYYQWASFIEYLLNLYGNEKFSKLHLTGNMQRETADYQGTYNKDLPTLEQEWRSWLTQ